MPENIFWHLNPKRLKPWQRHFEYSEQLRKDDDDYRAWLIGLYVREAIGSAFNGNKSPYPKEPMTIAQMREEQAEANRAAADKFAAFAMVFNERFRATQEQQQQNP